MSQFNIQCVFCGEKVKSPFMRLREDNVIHSKCLKEVERLHNNELQDDPMQELYQYILKLVIKCSKCLTAIDGSILYVAKQQKQDTLCNKCYVPLSVLVQKVEQKGKDVKCLLCQRELQGIALESATQIDGLHVCRECSHMQEKNLEKKNQSNMKKKMIQMIKQEERDDFSHLSNDMLGQEFKVSSQMPQVFKKKRSMPDLIPLKKIQIKEYSKYQGLCQLFQPKNAIQNKDIKLKILQPKQPPLKISENLKMLKSKQKKQEIKCLLCESYYFQDEVIKENGCNICFQCSGLNVNRKKKEQPKIIKDNDDFFTLQLTDLFKEETTTNPTKRVKPHKHLSLTKIQQKQQSKPQIKHQLKIQSLQHVQTQQSRIRTKYKYKLTECKLCFNAQSDMININCRHLMMCFKCYDMYRIKHNRGDEIPCPVCKENGKYQRYIAPIYI